LLSQLRRAVEDGERDALQAVDAEFENCRMAWRWAVAHALTDALAQSVTTLLNFCDHRGRFEEGLALLRETLESPLAQANPKLASLLLASAAHLEYRLDRYDDAQATAARALAATRSTRDHEARLQCFKVLGACCLRRGRYVDARSYFKQALEQAPESVDPHNAAAMLDNLALVEKAMGDYGEALRLSLQSLVQHRRLGDVADEAMCLNNLGAMYLDREEYASAGAYLREGLVLCDRHGLVSTRGLILANLAEFAVKTGDDDMAGTYGGRALDVAETTGNRALVCWLKLLFAQVALRRSDLAAVRAELAAALEIAIVIGRPALLVSGVTCFADLLAAQGETDCARRTLTLAADHPSTSDAQRAENRARLAQLPPATGTDSTTGIAFDELVHRIVVERDIAHAPLIAVLRGGR
jgi:tetratricopeptide (TPR) repeat protein